MPNHDLPQYLSYGGRALNRVGAGRTPGAHAYMDLTTAQSLELFLVQVVRVGALFTVATVQGNSIGNVRIEARKVPNGISAGDTLIAGPLEYMSAGPVARASWIFAKATPKPAPAQGGRLAGVITTVKGDYGFISPALGGTSIFVHKTQLRQSALAVGTRVSYVAADLGRGLAAYDVRSF